MANLCGVFFFFLVGGWGLGLFSASDFFFLQLLGVGTLIKYDMFHYIILNYAFILGFFFLYFDGLCRTLVYRALEVLR